MALSAKKQARVDRKRRMAYVLSVSITGVLWRPFGEANWDRAAQNYIETGNENFKKEFPSRKLQKWEVGL
jgi:hypothetical protein